MFTPLFQIILDLDQEAVNQGIPNASVTNYEAGFALFIGGVLRAVMASSAIIALIFLLWGAVDWISSANEKGKIDTARNKITGAVIGMVVLASTIAIYMLIQGFLGLSTLNFI